MTIIYFILFSFLFGSENSHIQVMEKFKENYNSNNYDLIFDNYNSNFQSFLPKDKSKNFLNTLKLSLGEIKSYEYKGQDENNFHIFKTQFNIMIMSVMIAIDNNEMISGFSIQPYTEKTKTEYQDLTKLPDEIKLLLLENLSNFPNNTQISFATMKDKKINFYGIKIENDKIIDVNNKKKIFEIGSITKVFSSILLANFILDKKVKLDDNINQYLDFKLKNDVKITFKSLANHTSGLPRIPTNLDINNTNISNPYANYTEKELKEYLQNELELATDKSYAYSNLGSALIPYVLSKIDKKKLKQLYHHYIFEEYNLTNTTCNNTKDLDIVKGIDEKGNEVSNWEFDVLFGAGGILSCVEDMSIFLQSLTNEDNKELRLTLKETYSDENTSIGLAWHTVQFEDISFNWHNGGTGGYTSSMAFDQNTNSGVIILTNISSFHPNKNLIDEFCFELMNQLK